MFYKKKNYINVPFWLKIEILSYLELRYWKKFDPLQCFGRFKKDYFRKIFCVRKTISIEFCPNFDGKNLPNELVHLTVRMCPNFDGKNVDKRVNIICC
jgi:hypothetical protein